MLNQPLLPPLIDPLHLLLLLINGLFEALHLFGGVCELVLDVGAGGVCVLQVMELFENQSVVGTGVLCGL